MKCQICSQEVPQMGPNDKHIVITKNLESNHTHIHGDWDQPMLAAEMIQDAADAAGVSMIKQKIDIKEVVFRNRMRIGDTLMFTCGVRDFKRAFPNVRVNVVSTAMHIWDHNPHLDRDLVPTDSNTIKIGPSILTNASNRLDWHFANAYRISIENALKVHIPQGRSRPDIYLTEEEYNAPRVFNDPYWIISTSGEKGWGCKMYPFRRWQEFIYYCESTFPEIKFVQIGTREDNPPRLQGKNVVDYVGKTQDRDTGIRDLFKLFLNAEGSIGLVSFHMHLSGALYKPSIVIAGAREPVSFTRYPGHQYISTDGCLPCAANGACWRCDINACTNIVEVEGERIPRCVDIIDSHDLLDHFSRYYSGKRLSTSSPSSKPERKLLNIVSLTESKQALYKDCSLCPLMIKSKEKVVIVPETALEAMPDAQNSPKTPVTPRGGIGKTIKVVSTARGWGGCARSVTTLMQFLIKAGHTVEFIPFLNKVGSREYRAWLAEHPEIKVTESYDTVKDPCDIMVVYADDYVWEFGNQDIEAIFGKVRAGRRVMVCNYRLGGIGQHEWTRSWDKYLFLNSSHKNELINRIPGADTKVLAPCTDLSPFLNLLPRRQSLNHSCSPWVKIVRHSSQGDAKFDRDHEYALIKSALGCREFISIDMLPGPSWIDDLPGFKKHLRTDNPYLIARFLNQGNLFWYSLPIGYVDAGPRVILEAMAAGLPVIADNWGGAIDRITPETGWLCSEKSQMLSIIEGVSVETLERMGEAARQRAIDEFIPERWVEEVIG